MKRKIKFDEINRMKIRTMKLVLVAGILLMSLKFLAYFITGSNAVLTDAIESIVNVIAGSFALYGVFYAAKPKDEDHPYGHGKIEFLSAGFEGGMICIAGLAMFFKGITAFFTKDQVLNAEIGIFISAGAGAINYWLGKLLLIRGKKANSDLMIAEGHHLISDTLSSIGLIIGLILIYITGLNWIDYVVTIIFGAIISYSGFRLIYSSITNLLDQSDQEKINKIIELLNKNRRDQWVDLHNLRVLKYGAHLHIDSHITLPWYLSLEEAHAEVDQLQKMMENEFDHEIEFFIHADPCIPKISCEICQLSNCPKREKNMLKKINWTVKNLLPNSKHEVSTEK